MIASSFWPQNKPLHLVSLLILLWHFPSGQWLFWKDIHKSASERCARKQGHVWNVTHDFLSTSKSVSTRKHWNDCVSAPHSASSRLGPVWHIGSNWKWDCGSVGLAGEAPEVITIKVSSTFPVTWITANAVAYVAAWSQVSLSHGSWHRCLWTWSLSPVSLSLPPPQVSGDKPVWVFDMKRKKNCIMHRLSNI